MTMKLTASMMLSLDGVYQGPGGPDEDRRDGFDRGGWTAAYGDEEGWRFLPRAYRVITSPTSRRSSPATKSILTDRIGKLSSSKLALVLAGIDIVRGR
jgi:hypothetical protein